MLFFSRLWADFTSDFRRSQIRGLDLISNFRICQHSYKKTKLQTSKFYNTICLWFAFKIICKANLVDYNVIIRPSINKTHEFENICVAIACIVDLKLKTAPQKKHSINNGNILSLNPLHTNKYEAWLVT